MSSFVSNFGPEVDKPEILTILENLSKIHAISAEDLYIKWEQFSIGKNETHTEYSLRNLDQFKQFLQQQVEKHAKSISSPIIKNKSNNPSSSLKKPRSLRPLNASPMFGIPLNSSPRTPLLKKRKLASANQTNLNGNTPNGAKLEFNNGNDSNSDIKMEQEQGSERPPASDIIDNETSTVSVKSEITFDSANTSAINNMSNVKIEPGEDTFGKILDSLNPENMDVSTGLNLNILKGLESNSDKNRENKVKIAPFYDPQKYKFRTMRQNLIDASDVLDEQIEIFTKIIQEHYNLSPNQFSDPTIQSQSEIYTVGRIVPDSPTFEGRLNTESIALETSRILGIGRRVRLDLSNIKELSLFCGQIVGLRGKNANNENFLVDEILSLPYPDAPVSTEEEIKGFQENFNNETMKVIVTSGPYFSETNIDMTPLIDFVDKINNQVKPHVVIMFGPFIDLTNPLISSGSIPTFPNLKIQPKTLDELFTKVMTPILKTINSQIQVILIPCTRDALSQHASYPQDSFDRKQLQLPKNFKCFTNPSTFQLNETFFGCSNVDIFKDLKEVTKGGETSSRNRFDRISEHILQQRRYYPIFPGGTRNVKIDKEKKIFKHIAGADLEVPYLGLTEFVGNVTPDVMIFPSEMPRFARVIQNVIMINPGRFIKQKGGKGTFAQITITKPSLEDDKLTKMENDDESVYLHNVWKRARVDLVST
ncbi:DNA-directed DNA polymerase alpha subunit POL12 NDAI_0A05370 [Naumovozyma dairenensis CBS 421]|uniref:DNA polymerase alpha subunit B n=1 Tax=Naumovozyma dairenensis (strain ATCC 10597 / BCRC 20456 / CBS 421 / NBRC 0211 / NRRL Y-12639) TaxID=1071378 RepID=G0W4F4_NAUDC|nr:hypothetical protein NDAI_0A05370 [Naumovozyma dairenensis CBS 421]CCD22692.1 hypothetical protein NDAI_0A05370 [Naumovozyma dairenensis CBS 421]